jgi:hypothetical protein
LVSSGFFDASFQGSERVFFAEVSALGQCVDRVKVEGSANCVRLVTFGVDVSQEVVQSFSG